MFTTYFYKVPATSFNGIRLLFFYNAASLRCLHRNSHCLGTLPLGVHDLVSFTVTFPLVSYMKRVGSYDPVKRSAGLYQTVPTTLLSQGHVVRVVLRVWTASPVAPLASPPGGGTDDYASSWTLKTTELQMRFPCSYDLMSFNMTPTHPLLGGRKNLSNIPREFTLITS